MTMTTIEEITLQLRRHAEGTSAANDETVLADAIWMLKHGSADLPTAAIWERIVNEFDRLNGELRQVPSDYGFPRQLVYAANELIAQCLDYVASEENGRAARAEVLELGWHIATAWDAVVAGDIDDIKEHVELERNAR